MPSLSRVRDGAGDSGPMLLQFRYDKQKGLQQYQPKDVQDIRIGWAVRVGSFIGRTFSAQDYWTTTYVTEILESEPGRVKFKTGNSVYVLTD